MANANVMAGSNRLKHAIRGAPGALAGDRETWNDSVRQRFEERYLLPLDPADRRRGDRPAEVRRGARPGPPRPDRPESRRREHHPDHRPDRGRAAPPTDRAGPTDPRERPGAPRPAPPGRRAGRGRGGGRATRASGDEDGRRRVSRQEALARPATQRRRGAPARPTSAPAGDRRRRDRRRRRRQGRVLQGQPQDRHRVRRRSASRPEPTTPRPRSAGRSPSSRPPSKKAAGRVRRGPAADRRGLEDHRLEDSAGSPPSSTTTGISASPRPRPRRPAETLPGPTTRSTRSSTGSRSSSRT